MIYYLVAAASPLLFWGIYELGKEKQNNQKAYKKWMVFLGILPMVLMFVLRYRTIGADTPGYVKFFQTEIRQISFWDLFNADLFRVETGYRIYVKLISYLTSSYTIYFLINAIVIFGTLYRFSFKFTENPFIFFFLFITLGTYQFIETGLRQGLAMTICIWALSFVKDRKPLKFILTVVLAYYFHKSAVIFLMIYPLSLIKRREIMIFIYAILTAIFTVGFAAFQSFFNELLGYEYSVEGTGNGLIFLILVTVTFLYSLIVTQRKDATKETNPLVVHMAFITVLFWVLRLISRTAERISYYFIPGLYLYFAQTTKYNDDKIAVALRWLLIVVCFALFVYRNVGATYLFFWARR